MTRIGARMFSMLGNQVVSLHLSEHIWTFSHCNRSFRGNMGYGNSCQECTGEVAFEAANMLIQRKLVETGIMEYLGK